MSAVLRVRRGVAPKPVVRGLPGALPEGERVLWQGSPDWRTLLLRGFHVRGVAIYFVLVLLACLVSSVTSGLTLRQVALSEARLTALALVPIVLMTLYCWGVGRTTIYTITNQRVAISMGMVVPMSLNLPYRRIESANLHVYPNGAGDIPMTLLATEKLAYLLVWPHSRPWRMARAEPMLRCVPGAAEAAAILGRALAAHAETEAVPAPTYPHLVAKAA